MHLDYGTQLSFSPIVLPIGTIKKPLLRDISDITFSTFYFYEFLLKLTPEDYYDTIVKDESVKDEYYLMPEDEKKKICIFDIIANDQDLQNDFCSMLNFFFVENVVFDKENFEDGAFLLVKKEDDNICITGYIGRDSFAFIIELLQELCCIYSEEEDVDKLKFKNNFGKKLYLKMLKAKKAAKKKAKPDKNSSLPNIISSVVSKHPSLNFTNVYDITLFQLIDSFQRLKGNAVYDITARGVSVWGDEKKTFDFSMWHKNYYDK